MNPTNSLSLENIPNGLYYFSDNGVTTEIHGIDILHDFIGIYKLINDTIHIKGIIPNFPVLNQMKIIMNMNFNKVYNHMNLVQWIFMDLIELLSM